jgi:hypothetical protein
MEDGARLLCARHRAQHRSRSPINNLKSSFSMSGVEAPSWYEAILEVTV